ncbi:unnamed protein product, partial [Mesorhabditis spiculigera]
MLAPARRTLLSSAFALDETWAGRHKDLQKLGLGGDYEWLATVQKKFIGGGVGSAVDVDAAVCIAEHKDQVDDVTELVYKLRHSPSAADLLPSTEYALLRLLLKHQPDQVFQLADDPINYGVFPNEHSACLLIDHFLEQGNTQNAARLATWVMLQEMTDNSLLNLLSLYAVAKWSELPAEERTLPMKVEAEAEEEDINEDDMRTFKFPWLKNEWNDGHFDVVEADVLVGKTLRWMARDTKEIDDATRRSAIALGAHLARDAKETARLVQSGSVHGAVAQFIVSQIEAHLKAQGAEAVPSIHQQAILSTLGAKGKADPGLFSDVFLKALQAVQPEAEKQLMAQQKAEFAEWAEKRTSLVRAQAERLLLKVKLEDVEAELAALQSREEKLNFFESRLTWEKRADDNDQIEAVEGKKKAATA